MSLSDILSQPEPADARRPSTQHRSEVRFSASGAVAEADVSRVGVPQGEDAFRDAIKAATGFDIPPHRQVLLDRVSVWGRDPETDEPYVACKFKIVDRPGAASSEVDGVAILKELRSVKRSSSTRSTGDNTLVLSFNDWQVGMLGGGGTTAFLERLSATIDRTEARVKELRKLGRGIGELVILGLGDLVDGCGMRPNQGFELDLDRRGQINVVVASILEFIDRIAPLFTRVRVLAVGGNHGENRLDYKYTTLRDNDDNAVFEHAARAVERDKRLGHVEFYIAQDAMSKTIEVNGWVIGITHGHAFGKGSGGSIETKVQKWLSGQALGRQPVGDADILVTAHYHHLQVRDYGSVQWVQAPALDGGSAWFTNISGQHSAPGLLSFVVTNEKRMQDLEVL